MHCIQVFVFACYEQINTHSTHSRPFGRSVFLHDRCYPTLHSSHSQFRPSWNLKRFNLEARSIYWNYLSLFASGNSLCPFLATGRLWFGGWDCKVRVSECWRLRLRGMMIEMNVFGTAADGLAGPLTEAFRQFRDWCKSKKIRSSQRPFKPRHLVREGYGYFLSTKGFNARLVSEFLMDKISEVNAHPNHFEQLIADERAVLAEGALIPGNCLVHFSFNYVQSGFRINRSCQSFDFFWLPRKGINRYFGLTERFGRVLPL